MIIKQSTILLSFGVSPNDKKLQSPLAVGTVQKRYRISAKGQLTGQEGLLVSNCLSLPLLHPDRGYFDVFKNICVINNLPGSLNVAVTISKYDYGHNGGYDVIQG